MRIAGVVLVAIGTVYALAEWAWRPLRCSRAASNGRIALADADALRDDQRRETGRRVRAALEGCDCVSPANAAIPVTLARAAALEGDPRAAIAHYEGALRIDRRPEIYFALGLAQLEALERRAAIASLTRACAFDPALAARIPYDDVRREVARNLIAEYGRDW